MTRPNAFTADFSDTYVDSDPAGYRGAETPFGSAAGGRELAVRLYEVPPGQNHCPYHYEYVEEWLLVIAGDIKIRRPAATEPATAGDLVCFPAGPEGAHKVFNDSQSTARIMMFSVSRVPEVCVYPDSDKVGVWTSNPEDQWMFRRAQGHLEYFDGEVPQSS